MNKTDKLTWWLMGRGDFPYFKNIKEVPLPDGFSGEVDTYDLFEVKAILKTILGALEAMPEAQRHVHNAIKDEYPTLLPKETAEEAVYRDKEFGAEMCGRAFKK